MVHREAYGSSLAQDFWGLSFAFAGPLDGNNPSQGYLGSALFERFLEMQPLKSPIKYVAAYTLLSTKSSLLQQGRKPTDGRLDHGK